MGKIKYLIIERQDRSHEAILEVSEKCGLDQCIVGPYITIPLKEMQIIDKKEVYSRNQLHLLPDQLKIAGSVVPEAC